jgi:hypothetical protein
MINSRKIHKLERSKKRQMKHNRKKPYHIVNTQNKQITLKRDEYRFHIKERLYQYHLIYYGNHDHFKQDILTRLQKDIKEAAIWEIPNYFIQETPQAHVITYFTIRQFQQKIQQVVEKHNEEYK